MEALSGVLGQRRGRRLFEQLLVPPLDRALPLAELDQRAVAVPDDLYLDVARVPDQRLEVDAAVPERGARFGLGHGEDAG